MSRPTVVRVRKMWNRHAKQEHQDHRRGDPGDRTGAPETEAGRSSEIGKPPEITRARPRATFIMPSVGMNGCGKRSLVSSVPLTAPSVAPMASEAGQRERGRHAGLQQQRRQHAGESHDRADREVDARGDDDQQLSERDQRVDSGLAKDVDQVVERQEMVGQHAQRGAEDDQARAAARTAASRIALGTRFNALPRWPVA